MSKSAFAYSNIWRPWPGCLAEFTEALLERPTSRKIRGQCSLRGRSRWQQCKFWTKLLHFCCFKGWLHGVGRGVFSALFGCRRRRTCRRTCANTVVQCEHVNKELGHLYISLWKQQGTPRAASDLITWYERPDLEVSVVMLDRFRDSPYKLRPSLLHYPPTWLRL